MSDCVVIGVPELLAKLRRLSDEAAMNILAASVQNAAGLIETEAKARAPWKTRTLQRSIHTQVTERTRNSVTAVVGTNVAYARVIEYGFHGAQAVRAHTMRMTQVYGRLLATPLIVAVRAHVRLVNRAARPYLRPALDATRGAVIAEIQTGLRLLLAQVAA